MDTVLQDDEDSNDKMDLGETFDDGETLESNCEYEIEDVKATNCALEPEQPLAAIKFLGIIIDENLTWTNHISTIENKISKNIGILYKAKFLLNQTCLKHIYFAFIHSY